MFLATTLIILGGLFSVGVAFLDSGVLVAALINICFSFLEVSLLLALATLFASFTAPLNASLYTLALFFIGHSQSSMKEYIGALGNSLLNGFVNVVYYILPNLEKFDVKKATLYNVAIPASQVGWSIFYWFIAVVVILFLATLIVRKQEF